MKKKRRYRSLADWLDRTGTRQRTLARKVGITDSTVSMLLRGSRRCSLRTAIALSNITGIPVQKLVEWPQTTQRVKLRGPDEQGSKQPDREVCQ